MRLLPVILITCGLFSCESTKPESVHVNEPNVDLETLAHEGVFVDFNFNSDKPIFGDIFLIMGFENPNFPPDRREFEKLQHLGFDQVDDYFGIKNDSDIGDDVKIWLYPMINEETVHHNKGPFDAMRVVYVVLRNDTKTADIFKNIYLSFTETMNVTPTFFGQPVDDYSEIGKVVDETIQYCREELNVEPGSDEALLLDW